MHRLRNALTKAASLVSHSFHHPRSAEKLAQMKISLTGREVAHPRIVPREIPRVIREQDRERVVLKAAKPGRNTEMAEVGDHLNAKLAEPKHGRVGGVPLESIGRDVRAILRRTVAESVETHLANQREIILPALVVTTLGHLIDPGRGVGQGHNCVASSARGGGGEATAGQLSTRGDTDSGISQLVMCRGSRTVNVVPCPSDDATSIRPWCAATIRSTM